MKELIETPDRCCSDRHKPPLKVLLIGRTGFDMIVVVEDGGFADVNLDGEFPLTTYYQDRISPDLNLTQGELWELAAECKQYCKDWDDEGRDHKVTQEEFIEDAVAWLRMNENRELDIHYDDSPEECIEETILTWLKDNFVRSEGVGYLANF